MRRLRWRYFFRSKTLVGLGLSLLLSLIMTAPPLIDGLLTPGGWVWTGYYGGGIDYPTYLAKIQQGYLGNWTYYDRLTSEHTDPVPIYPFYLLLGHLARLTNIGIPTVFHLSRFLLAWGAFYLFWAWLQLNKRGAEEFLVGICYSGVALLGLLFGIKLRIQEYFWAVVLTFPHYSLDAVGIFAILIGNHLLVKENKRSGWYYGVLGATALLLSHPFLLVLAFGTVLWDGLIFESEAVKRTIQYAGGLALLVSPWVLYQWSLFNSVEWLKIWRHQSQFPSPALWKFMIEQGFVIVVLLLFRRRIIEDIYLRSLSIWWLWAWSLAYSNLLLNSGEFAFLIGVPTGLLAMKGLEWLLSNVRQRRMWLTLALSLATWGAVAGLWLNVFQAPPAKDANYLPPQYMAGMEFLRSHGQKEDIVLSAVAPGSFIPYLTGLKPYVAHPCETLEYRRKVKEAQKFFSGKMSEAEAKEFLDKNKIRWIIADEQEWTFETPVSTAGLKTLPYQGLEKLLDNGVVRVWKYLGK